MSESIEVLEIKTSMTLLTVLFYYVLLTFTSDIVSPITYSEIFEPSKLTSLLRKL